MRIRRCALRFSRGGIRHDEHPPCPDGRHYRLAVSPPVFEQGCDVATTEMVSAMGYLYAPRNHPATVSLIERRDSEGELLVQIFGKEADLMARAAEELSAMGRFDGVDVNMGCPAHKVAASGEGSGLMRTPGKRRKNPPCGLQGEPPARIGEDAPWLGR